MIRKRLTYFVVSAFLIYFAYGLFLSRYELSVIPSTLKTENPNYFYDYKGAINVQTQLSTGSGELQEVIQAAHDSQLDFIFITDLNLFDRPKNIEGYHGNTIVFIDGKYSYLNSRLLNLDASSNQHLLGPGRSQAFFADLLSQKERSNSSGLFILSHPFKPGYGWKGDFPIGLNGLEVINLKTIWQNAWLNSRFSFFWTLLIYPFNSELSFIRLFTHPEQEFNLFDKLSQNQNMIAIAGTDAEARLVYLKDKSLQFPTYQMLFHIVTNHVLLNSELTGQYDKDRSKIVEAIRKGQMYLSLDILANPKGFSSYIKNKKGEIFPIGSKLKFKPGMELRVELPNKPLVPFETILIKNGEILLTSNSQSTRYNIHGPGVYRVVVRVIPTFPLPDGKKWVPWIYSNPFYVGS